MDEETTKKLSFLLAKSCLFTNTMLEPLSKGEKKSITLTQKDSDILIKDLAKNIYTVLRHPEIEKLPSFWFPDSWEDLKEDEELLEKIKN